MKRRFQERYNRWPVAIMVSLWKVLLALAYARIHHTNYFVNLFYYVDIFANALTGGHPYVTVSARVGRYAQDYRGKSKSFTRWFWLFCERCINFAFKPIDGEHHCYQATIWTETVIKDPFGKPVKIRHGPLPLLLVLLPIVLISCIILTPLIKVLNMIGILPKNEPFDPGEYLHNLERR